MTYKEQIIAIIKQYADKGERLFLEASESNESYAESYWDGYECCAKGLLRELEDVQEESINNGLDLGCGVIWKEEESASEELEKEYDKYIETDGEEPLSKEYFLKLCQHFANWQKQQLMAKAVDAVVKVDAGGYPYVDATIELYDYDMDIPLAKNGDKVKIVVIKED